MALLPGEQGDAAPGESAPTTRTWYACPWYTPAGNMDHQDNYSWPTVNVQQYLLGLLSWMIHLRIKDWQAWLFSSNEAGSIFLQKTIQRCFHCIGNTQFLWILWGPNMEWMASVDWSITKLVDQKAIQMWRRSIFYIHQQKPSFVGQICRYFCVFSANDAVNIKWIQAFPDTLHLSLFLRYL